MNSFLQWLWLATHAGSASLSQAGTRFSSGKNTRAAKCGRRLSVLAALLTFSAIGRAEEPAGTEMVEFEVRFLEATPKQVSGLITAKAPGPSGDGLEFSQPLPSDAPPILAVAGVITPEQTSAIFKGLKDQGVEVTAVPRTATLTGKRAQVQNVREFRYPSKFSEPDKSGNVVPVEFETRPIGITLEFEPKIEFADTINTILSLHLAKLTGFADENTKPSHLSVPGHLWQPIFKTSELTTEVTLASRQTIIFSTASKTSSGKEDFIFITVRKISSP